MTTNLQAVTAVFCAILLGFSVEFASAQVSNFHQTGQIRAIVWFRLAELPLNVQENIIQSGERR